MSPIGRVFVILNVVLAGVFLGFSGTHLQKQHSYKSRYEAEAKAHIATTEKAAAEKAGLEKERNNFENAKTSVQTQYEQAQVTIGQLQDENKRLTDQNNSFSNSYQQLVSAAEAAKTEMKAAFTQAKAAYDLALESQKVKDASVTEKDAALAENRNLKNTIQELNDTVAKKDLEIAGLNKDKSELGMLVKVAETNGFLRAMAAPNLSGMVTTARGGLATIQVTDNPGKVDIARAIETGNVSFAIYDASGYKGEAIAQSYEASANAVFCKIKPVKGEVKQGDRASTKTN